MGKLDNLSRRVAICGPYNKADKEIISKGTKVTCSYPGCTEEILMSNSIYEHFEETKRPGDELLPCCMDHGICFMKEDLDEALADTDPNKDLKNITTLIKNIESLEKLNIIKKRVIDGNQRLSDEDIGSIKTIFEDTSQHLVGPDEHKEKIKDFFKKWNRLEDLRKEIDDKSPKKDKKPSLKEVTDFLDERPIDKNDSAVSGGVIRLDANCKEFIENNPKVAEKVGSYLLDKRRDLITLDNLKHLIVYGDENDLQNFIDNIKNSEVVEIKEGSLKRFKDAASKFGGSVFNTEVRPRRREDDTDDKG